MNKDIERILFTREEISQRVKEVGAQISEDYKGREPIFVGILKGGAIFLSDLIRTLDIPCEIDFVSVSSYGESSVSSGKATLKKDTDKDIKGRDVIIVEDILDTALTLDSMVKMFEERSPASLKTCVLLDKNVERKIDFRADYKCFDVENEFIVGYGLDYAQKYRQLPYIGVLKREIYDR